MIRPSSSVSFLFQVFAPSATLTRFLTRTVHACVYPSTSGTIVTPLTLIQSKLHADVFADNPGGVLLLLLITTVVLPVRL